MFCKTISNCESEDKEMKKLMGRVRCTRAIAMFLGMIMLLGLFVNNAYAEKGKTDVLGKVYTFGKDSKYEFSESKKYKDSNEASTYGIFSLSGDVGNISTQNDVPSYEVKSGNLELFYTYGDSLLKANEKSWHLVDDKGKSVDGKKLDEKIMKGAIILQTSKDRKNWVDVKCITNAFGKTQIQTGSTYKTKDVELLNGCYYRLIVAYETRKMVETNKVLFVSVNDYKYQKIAEVYEFYAYAQAESSSESAEKPYNIGKKVRTKKFEGYSGEQAIVKDKDSHDGWDLGQFFISGHTEKQKGTNGEMVFLKNVGDKVTLSFNLKQNINKLNGNKNLYISADTEGYDQYFETPRMDFGKGMLIVRHTDDNNVSTQQYYKNYLEANATVGADTIVQLFEEGDYEVALDYEVTNDKLVDSVAHYRIFFKFSVRNGNCMVYPFDVVTGDELANSSMTDNGFKIDKAKSRYLEVNVKREVLTDSADGLVEDTRSNGPARDGAEYTDEGIYTIQVHNKYTNQFTTKKIYVGTNKVLKAYMTTGLTIPEINNLIATGATIANDGTVTLATGSTVTDTNTNEQENREKNEQVSQRNVLPIGIAVCIFVILVVVIAFMRKKKYAKNNEEGEKEGGNA